MYFLGRQRLTSSSDDNIALRVSTCFAQARAWIDSSSTHLPRDTTLNKNVKAVESLFIMNCHGNLVQYDLEPHHASHIPKEKVCDDSPIELLVTAKAQVRATVQIGFVLNQLLCFFCFYSGVCNGSHFQ